MYFKTEHCGKKLKTKECLRNHLKIFHEVKCKECDVCDKVFNSQHGLDTHMHIVHKKREKHQCLKCSKVFSTMFSLEVHCKNLHQIIFICTLCQTKLTSKQKLLDHLNLDHKSESNENELYPCPICKLKNCSLKELNNHLFIKHESSIEPVTCKTCDEKFSTKLVLSIHEFERHEFDPESDVITNGVSVKVVKDELEEGRKLKCEECGKKVKSKRVLEDHIRQVHKKETHSHFCTQCDYSSYSAYRLKSHIQRKHEKKRLTRITGWYKCPDCSKSFHDRQAKAKHMWSEHGKVFKYTPTSRKLKYPLNHS